MMDMEDPHSFHGVLLQILHQGCSQGTILQQVGDNIVFCRPLRGKAREEVFKPNEVSVSETKDHAGGRMR